MNLVRTLILVAFLAGLAILVPRVAPSLIAALVDDAAPHAAVTEAPPARAPGRELTIRANTGGHFIVNALVDGHAIEMLVDTGATLVALNESTARRLGIRLSPGDYTATIGTANGTVRAAPIMLSAVSDALGINLLGMSFLKRLAKFDLAGTAVA